MLKTIHRLLVTIVLLTISLLGYAVVRITTGGVQYTSTSDNTVTACLTVKATDDVEIQGNIIIKGKNYTTTCIGEAYFKKNEYLTSVTIPNTVTKIEKYAFRGCSNMSKIIIPDTPCSIDETAFDGCTAIASVRTHTKGGQIDYLLAVIDTSNPCFTNNVVVIDEEPDDGQVIKVVRKKTSSNVEDMAEAEVEEDIEDIDINIPKVRTKNENTFALIIGNENYKRLTAVPFATNDAKIFAEYCEKTLGIPSANIDMLPDATQNDIRHGVLALTNRLDAYKGEGRAIVYYAGHGIPDEKDKTAYLLPIDGYASDVESGYSLDKLYKSLSSVPSQQIVVFLDACFSGAKRDGEMLASARGVAIKVKETAPEGKLLVFSAATGDETAICDKDFHHGIFTYYLLKCLRDHKGQVPLGELSEYVTDNVKKRSVIINNGKMQTPTVIPSASMSNDWQKVILK